MSRAVLQPFEEYQKSRVQFVQTVAVLARKPQNIEALQAAGVMALLKPLLLDNVPSIQQSAALALGRLANYSEDLAEAVVSADILNQLVLSLSEQNRFYKKAAAFVLRAVAKHSVSLAQNVVDSGALDALVVCLEEFDPSVKEAAAWALSNIAKHSAELAQSVVDVGAVPLLVLCIQEPETALKRVSAGALGEICRHSQELAQHVVDAGAVPFLSALIPHHDAPLKRQVCNCLGYIARHTIDLAENVVEAEIFPKILYRLKDQDPLVRKFAATCIREIAKQSQDLSKLICNAGGAVAIVDYINEARDQARLPGIITLGYISAFDESLAMSVISAKGIAPLKDALINEKSDLVQASAAWTLGQIGGHSPDHARAMAEADIPSTLLTVYKFKDSSEDLKKKCKKALKSILQMCSFLSALEPLISESPDDILQYVLHQFAKTLPHDNQAKKNFVLSEGLKKIQEIKAAPGSKLRQYIDTINQLYPQEIIQFYSPGYEQTLLKKLEDYNTAD
ncbi:sperm-associated antigen 6 (macronuclear) [Tetrahymena thermophila SB210]|uniref:Sperm-associated antigen 6 n=1 Tax=Tetrahymena thermophila (strain SB210) TaxID=312017 RepID=W7X9A6_TETTS|nr:sperm-associated antigen 6 [Tetrahymena thermophila SB210]EWS75980.1 sperm-associated antigen 6 [Tetrahymena thermophila SB210]|eukprot:XP_012651498.1 sperm-associated antigen 6 [Tetrahymena thermophila SB210]